jgi:hypothetical protein
MVGCSRSVRGQRVRGAVVPRAGRWLCRDALPTTSYPCRQGSPDTPFRVRRDKRVLDPAEDAPSTVSAPARTGLPGLGTGVLARETACATLSGLLASFLSSPTLSAQFFCSTRAAHILPSRPQRVPGAARRPCQGWPAGPSVDDGLGLDEVEHGARLAISGCSQCRTHAAALVLRRAPCGTMPCSR